jgi:hypothetical protein
MGLRFYSDIGFCKEHRRMRSSVDLNQENSVVHGYIKVTQRQRWEMMIMDHCGVEFTVIRSGRGSSWKWKLSILDKDKMRTSGEAASRSAAISDAHEAIGEGLRANASPEDEARPPDPACDIRHILHILHGARSLPSTEAVEVLRPFVNTMHNRISGSDRLADAAAGAVGALVQRLEAKGIATDDLWEEAIEASLSFANETQLI